MKEYSAIIIDNERNFLKAYSSYQDNYAELTDGTRLSISRRKLNDFREAVKHFSKSIE